VAGKDTQAWAGKRVIQVSVRDLVEFVWRTGDLGADIDFLPPSRALEGIRGHQRIQRCRPADYVKEVPVEYRVETDTYLLRLRGRIDGVLREPDRVTLEEIKTIQRPLKAGPDPLHWAQLKVYAALWLQSENASGANLRLTYLELETGVVREYVEFVTGPDLHDFFTATITVYQEWLADQSQWCQVRDQSIRDLRFPFAHYRPGQREMAVGVYRTLSRGGRLFLEAPTGIGKTISVLFPALKVLGEGHCEKIFYLTAKTLGRTAVAKALVDLRQVGARLRALTLTAREKICAHHNPVCDPHQCPLALGYYDRVKPAIRAALQAEILDRSAVEAIARLHQVCPFELSLDTAVWVDLIIGDYNYVFDPRASLKRFFGNDAGIYAILVDEAHNLLERAREMFSAGLNKADLLALKRDIQNDLPACAKALNRMNRAWLKWRRGEARTGDDETSTRSTRVSRDGKASASGETQPGLFDAPDSGHPPLPLMSSEPGAVSGRDNSTHVARALPQELLDSARLFLREAEAWLGGQHAAAFRETLIEFYFQVVGFLRIAERFDERFVLIGESLASGDRLRLFCLDPARMIQESIPCGCGSVFFSGTLTPVEFFRQALGGETTDPVLRLSSPFPADNLAVLVHDRISTTYQQRVLTFDLISQAITAFISPRRGNYLVFFPSYQYLDQVLDRFRAHQNAHELLVQSPGMAEEQRESFLAQFSLDRSETLVGFAVMGGLFGESIDLVGERLAGAMIVGVGLPQICLERDLIRDYFDRTSRAGFDFAYRFPGMNRVLQAAGRVIRTETDRGCLLLIDTRFSQAAYRRLLPPGWTVQRVRSAEEIERFLRRFWIPPPAA
jgi:DNA excision repair protein ERCC-2